MAFPERSEKIPGSENFFSGKIVTLNWLHGWSQVIRSFGECVIYIFSKYKKREARFIWHPKGGTFISTIFQNIFIQLKMNPLE